MATRRRSADVFGCSDGVLRTRVGCTRMKEGVRRTAVSGHVPTKLLAVNTWKEVLGSNVVRSTAAHDGQTDTGSQESRTMVIVAARLRQSSQASLPNRAPALQRGLIPHGLQGPPTGEGGSPTGGRAEIYGW